jgi:subfamily B ATP-binding cassette protein MsbA
MAPPIAMKFLIDDVIHRRELAKLPWIVGVVVAATVFQQVTNYLLTQIFSRSALRLTGEIRCKLEAHALRLSLTYHEATKSGALGSHIMNDVAGLQNLVGVGLLGFIGSIATSLIALGIMGRYSPALGVMVGVSLTVVGVIVGRGTRRSRAIAHERTRIQADITGRLTEALGGMRVVKAYRGEAREDAIFAGGIQRLIQNHLRSMMLNSTLTLTTGLCWGLVSPVVIYIGAHRILEGKLQLGEFFTFMFLLNFAVAPLQQIVGVGNLVMEALAGLERTRDILQVPREDEDPRRTVEVGRLRGDVVFDHVSFSYVAGTPVLTDVSFRAAPGTVTALVGPSGSGKSTMIGLVASFYSAGEGRVLVDGEDVTTLTLDAYRSQLGVVLQETFLFAGSILDNVAFARPDAARAQILEACRAARVDEFAEKMPEGYDTLVGERGVMLSGGQRQRIAIARALLADPRILILDEATSSLDSHSEALIQEALSTLLVGRTTLVIAHRLSTIKKAHQILVVESGVVRERGTHEELLAQKGLYADMYRKQHQVDTDLFLGPGEGPREETQASVPTLPTAGEEVVALTLPGT